MDQLPPPPGDRGLMFLKANWIGVGFGILFVGARIFARLTVLKYLSLDDYLMITSLTFGIVNAALNTAGVNAGLGKHVQSLHPDQRVKAFKYQYMIQPFPYLAQIFGRISFAVSLIVLIGTNKSRRSLLNTLIIGQFVVNLIWVGLWLGQCNPPEKFWNRRLSGTCMDPRVQIDFGYITLAFNILTDLVLALLPSVVVSNLNMRLRTKLGLIFLMSLGILNMVAAVITAVELSKIEDSQDFTYDFILVDYWGIIQIYLVIVAASIPFIRPLFRNVKTPHALSWAFYISILHRYTRRSHSSNTPRDNEENLPMPLSGHNHSHIPRVKSDRFVTTTLKNMLVEDEASFAEKSDKLKHLEAATGGQNIRRDEECV